VEGERETSGGIQKRYGGIKVERRTQGAGRRAEEGEGTRENQIPGRTATADKIRGRTAEASRTIRHETKARIRAKDERAEIG
jgi:hypothetical protein